MNINVPVERIQFEYATEIVVLAPVSVAIIALKESTIDDKPVLNNLVFPRNIPE